ncbi:MAG: alpha/beta hydrolase [Dorea sp.]|nr:alpha/beta hydrolase [Dorea sp.]
MLREKDLTLFKSPFKKCATVYWDDEVELKAAILYFHGGGLLYGNRKDLPATHKRVFTEAGYAIITYDYPLSPAAKLDMIKADILASINDYAKDAESYIGVHLPYFLWGRSSGAYLVLLAAASGMLKEKPCGVLSYYGYGFLCDNWYQIPSTYYSKLPKVDAACLNFIPRDYHCYGDLQTHYGVYVYARQTGNWKNLIYEGRDKFFLLDYSLRTISSLPCPLFCAHSTGDTDVPYSEFLELAGRYHARRFIAATKEHDFDRDEDGPYIKRLLDSTMNFIYEKLPSQERYQAMRQN